jgi:hypothetical protein
MANFVAVQINSLCFSALPSRCALVRPHDIRITRDAGEQVFVELKNVKVFSGDFSI